MPNRKIQIIAGSYGTEVDGVRMNRRAAENFAATLAGKTLTGFYVQEWMHAHSFPPLNEQEAAYDYQVTRAWLEIDATNVRKGLILAVCEPVMSPIQPCAHDGCLDAGMHPCPKCKKLYCDTCRTMFLPIDPMFPVPTAMMCPGCHYETYRQPMEV